jgi:histidine triad (HIT) family protein
VSETCLFCDIVAGNSPATILFQDRDVIVFKDLHPQAPVHILVVPKTHYAGFIQIPDDLLQKIFAVAKKIIIDQQLTSYRLVNNSLATALVPHFHLHILGKIEKFRRL